MRSPLNCLDKARVLIGASIGGHILSIETQSGHRARFECLPAHLAEVPATWAHMRRTGRLLDWAPKTRIEAGPGDLLSWYQADQSWVSPVRTG
jgi:hypothetical protein